MILLLLLLLLLLIAAVPSWPYSRGWDITQAADWGCPGDPHRCLSAGLFLNARGFNSHPEDACVSLTKTVIELFKEALSSWSDDNAFRLAAALAYYGCFRWRWAPIIAIAVAGLAFGHHAASGEFSRRFEVSPDRRVPTRFEIYCCRRVVPARASQHPRSAWSL